MNVVYWLFSALELFEHLLLEKNKQNPHKTDRKWALPERSGYLKKLYAFVIYYIKTFPSEVHFNQCIVKSTDIPSTLRNGRLI